MAAEIDNQRRRRDLRLRIGRARRRIDGRLHAVESRVRRLISWQKVATWVWREMKEVWAESTPQRRDEETHEGDHD